MKGIIAIRNKSIINNIIGKYLDLDVFIEILIYNQILIQKNKYTNLILILFFLLKI